MAEGNRRRRMPERSSEESNSLQQQIIDGAEENSSIMEQVGPQPETIIKDRLIPSGVTLLNCACSDNPFGAFSFGSINTIPGKSASGKTELMLTMLASCAVDSRFDEYELILDDAERTMSFNLNYLFPPLVERLVAPNFDGDEPVYSNTIQDFESAILLKCKKKGSFIYVLDSLDSLSSTEELEREYKNALKTAKSAEAIKELKQSYGTEKAKIIGSVLRMVNGEIKNSDSSLFIVQQTRQIINKTGFGGADWTTAGGEAPFFYSFHRVYTHAVKALTDEVRNVKHKIGGRTKAEVIKNKLNGKRRSIEFDIYEDLGIDDISSCVEFLKQTEHWRSSGAYLLAPEIIGSEKMHKADLVRFIEKEGAEEKLREIVGQIWNQIEDDMRLKDRKRRF